MDSFLKGMPDGLQANQAQAIYSAINGDPVPLTRIRDARKPVIELPPNTDTMRVRDDILLFYPTAPGHHEPMPLLMYLHGGGWTFGSINSCSRFCGALAAKGIMAAAVDYPLSPEHDRTSITNSIYDAFSFIHDNAAKWGGAADNVSVGGDSSGGNLALSTALEYPALIKSLILAYPVTDARTAATDGCPYGTGFGNDSILMEAFRDSYLGSGREGETLPEVSPIFATDEQLKSLPPILFIAAEYDILTPQGKEFQKRIHSIGGSIRYIEIPGTTHLFMTVPGQPTAFNLAVDRTTRFLKNQNPPVTPHRIGTSAPEQ